MKVGRKLVDFHGEMILLENYSALNYTGFYSNYETASYDGDGLLVVTS